MSDEEKAIEVVDPATQPIINPTKKDQPPEEMNLVALAAEPGVDVEKLDKLIAMQERREDRLAMQAYTRAFVKLQGELPNIEKRGFNKGLDVAYARMEDIQQALRPVLVDHGFALNFFTETDTETGSVSVTARLSHEEGHYEETTFSVKDPSVLKNKGTNEVQVSGSARSYAMRYAAASLLNLTMTGADDDGQGAGGGGAPKPPAGYEEWAADMESCADEGTSKLSEAWNNSKPEFKTYISKNQLSRWEAMKAKAASV